MIILTSLVWRIIVIFTYDFLNQNVIDKKWTMTTFLKNIDKAVWLK